MNKNVKIFAIAVLLIIVVGISGCNEENNQIKNSDEDKLIGTWANTSILQGITFKLTYIFFSDSTYEVISSYQNITESFNGTWKIIDNKLNVTIEGRSQEGYYRFSNNGKTLAITDTISKTTMILIKQE